MQRALVIVPLLWLLPGCLLSEMKFAQRVDGEAQVTMGEQRFRVSLSSYDSSRSESFADLGERTALSLYLSPHESTPGFGGLQLAFKVSRPLAVLGEPQVEEVKATLTEHIDQSTGAAASVDLAPPGWAVDARVLMDAFEDHAPEDPVQWDDEVLAQEASGRLAAVFTSGSSGRTLRVQSCNFRIGIYKVKAGLLD